MTIRFLKRYVKKGIIIVTLTLLITKYVSYLSLNQTSTEKTDAKSDKMANGKAAVIDSVRSYWREKKRVMRKSDLDASNIEALGSALSEFDEDDWKPSARAKTDLKAPGELGSPYIFNKSQLTSKEKLEYETGWKKNNFNEFASNRISLQRSLKDPRDKECHNLTYSENLPEVSIIVTFHNEAWSVLIRSVYSILNRTPDSLLKEVILVDDFSSLEHLKEPLDQFMEQFQKVKIVRATERQGLIRARLRGYREAVGDVLVFLDSHIECAEGWLEPLIDPIARNWSTVMTPVIDVIDKETFQYGFQAASATNVGGFDWSLMFTWHFVPETEQKRRQYKHYLPVRSPTMAGGLFAISRKYFEHIGTYDEGMDIWGGENLELSFRIWMCGGTLLTAPCSHVGHVFRHTPPYSFGPKKNVVKNNLVRMAEVWLDDFKYYYYQHINYTLGNYGDVSARRALRANLQCHSFDWYLVNVYPELLIPAEALYSGEIRSKAEPLCLESPYRFGKINKPLTVFHCHGQKGNQYWLYTQKGEIRHDLYGCIDDAGSTVYVNSCHGLGGNQKWTYREDNTIQHEGTDRCLELSADGKTVSVKKCMGIDRQLWVWNRKPPKGPVRSTFH
ncbi:polypeptide N-acetylgalactosaminyltransferase 5 [Magallana gigas]|uniref:polypeptide N-acetylgalactosaminyltransferase 5 n=1 Tax=Magallana gigas TaxID=29159 RepID=UPI00334266B1